MNDSLLSVGVAPDYEAFLRTIRRQGTPRRVHHIELFLDQEVQDAVATRFGLNDGIGQCASVEERGYRRYIAVQRKMGYDYARVGVDAYAMPFNRQVIADTAPLARSGGRSFMNEQTGPITNWEEFEKYPWPDPNALTTHGLEWFSANLPDDMCIIGSGGFAHFAEHITWLLGYETLCVALYENRALVTAIAKRLIEFQRRAAQLLLQFPRVKILWGSDDMGFRSGPMISPADVREFFFPGHIDIAQLAHDAGLPYLLHSCGNLESLMPELIDTVKIDGKHSFEDTIHDIVQQKRLYGDRIAILGGIDVDFLCRSDPAAIRQRVRKTLQGCQAGGGYCLGTGNSVTNYIPLENYLTMLDEGRRYAG